MIKRDVPIEFLQEYVSKHENFDKALQQITECLKLRLGQCAARHGVRGRITDKRVKRPAKLWKNAKQAGLDISEIFLKVEDLLGIRIVCNNISDVGPLIDMIKNDCSILKVLEIKDMISHPTVTGYRATHVRTELIESYSSDKTTIPCEIQIRTLAQDAWARLSREDLYGKEIPSSMKRLTIALSTQLSAIDDISQLIHDELNKHPSRTKEMSDSDPVNPQRLALLYKEEYGEDIYEWTLVDWVRLLEEAEVAEIGEVRKLLAEKELRRKLDDISINVRGFPIEDNEWVIYSALIASELTIKMGIKAVRNRIQEEWDEITSIAKREEGEEMPETIDEFIDMIKSGNIPVITLRELGGVVECFRCGNDILKPEVAANAILDYYDNPDIGVDLENLFIEAEGSGYPYVEIESVDFDGACQYCGYQMSKDD